MHSRRDYAANPLPFVLDAGRGYGWRMGSKRGIDVAGGQASDLADGTPSSASGIVLRDGGGAAARREAEPRSWRSLTPYQARLDVEMDDTAVSKVRDPSVSIRLGPDRNLGQQAGRPVRAREAAFAIVIGVALGALLVVAAVIALRAF